MTKDEMEVTISFLQCESTARLYTSWPRWIKKMDDLCEEQPDLFRCVEVSYSEGEIAGKFYEFPKDRISVKHKREVSEEQRAAASDRLSSYWKEKKEAYESDSYEDEFEE